MTPVARVFMACLALIAPVAAQSPPGELVNFGVMGPVKSIRMTRIALDPETPVKRWYRPADVCAQCSFDRLGRTESRDAGHDGNGNVTGRVEIRHGDDGRNLEEISYDNDGNETYRAITVNGPHGPIEVTDFLHGTLQATETTEYDAGGRLLHARRIEADGTVDYERSVTYGDNLVEERFRTPNNSRREIHKYNDSSEEWLDYDERDNLILRATFDGSQLTFWWMKKHAGIGVGFSIPNASPGQTVAYSSTDDGELERTLYLHPGRKGNVEPDEVIHFDSAGHLVEDAKISYQRDAHGNWISREIQLLDADQRQVVVQRDTREIKYW